MITDFRYALGLLVRSPGFSIIAVATLALGIGANTAIFSVLGNTLLRPLPFPAANRLVRLYETFEEGNVRGNALNLSVTMLREWREHGDKIFEGSALPLGRALRPAQGQENRRAIFQLHASARTF
jgi:hypothetical protein